MPFHSSHRFVQTHVQPNLKAYAALVGSIVTALLTIYGPDTEVGHWLSVIGVVATTVGTWAIPNLDPTAERQDESVQPPDADDWH